MNKKLILIILFMLFSSLFIACPVLSANEGKVATSYATDIYNRQLDHGIGRFICSTIDENCPGEIKVKNENYYVFEYFRNDSNNVRFDKYAVIDINDLPEFVKKGLIDSELIFGIHEDGYWTETCSKYVINEIKFDCLLESFIISGSSISMDHNFGINAYFNFQDINIDELLSLNFKFDVYKPKRFLGFLWKTGFDTKTVNSYITADEVVVNGEVIDGDFPLLSMYFGKNEIFSIGWKWLNNPIEKLSSPFVYNGISYDYKVNTGYKSEDFDGYFLNKEIENTRAFNIISITFVDEEITYYSDNLLLDTLQTIGGGSNKTGLLENENNIIIIIVLLLFLFLFISFFNNNKVVIYSNDFKSKRE